MLLTNIKIIAIFLFAVFVLGVYMPSGNTQTKVETAGHKFKSIQVLNDMPADQMGKVMNMISASLGVNCAFCHASNDGDYEKEGFEHKDMARKMIKMTFDLNKTQFNGRPEINCNSCHNGKSHPQPSFPLTTPVAAKGRPKQPDMKPTVDQIIAKYLTALGGSAKLESVKTGIIKANRVEPDGRTTELETIWLSDGSYRSDIVYGKNIVTEIFDGLAGKKYGDTAEIELKSDEAEQIKREGQLFFPSNLKTIYPKIDFRAVDRVDGREVNVVTATTANGVRDRLAFDAISGFLVRRTTSTPTVFGNFIYQVDYADYKDFGGIKMPTLISYAVPGITWKRKITDVKINVPVGKDQFKAPSAKN